VQAGYNLGPSYASVMSEETSQFNSSGDLSHDPVDTSGPVRPTTESFTAPSNVGSGDSKGTSSKAQSKLFIGGIPWSTTDATFTQFFSKYGELQDSVIIRDKHTRASRGFGFVKYTDPTAIDKVLAEPELVLDGRKLEVKVAIPKDEMEDPNPTKTKKLFIGGLSQATTDVEFKEHFAQFGTITDAVVMVDKETRRSRCFGFVTYESEDVAERVLSQTHTLNGKVCEIKRAVPKEDIDRPGRGGRRGAGRYDRDDDGYTDDYYSYGPERGRGRYDDDDRRGGYGDDRYGYGGYDSYGPRDGWGGRGGYDGGWGGPGGYGGRDSRSYHPYR